MLMTVDPNDLPYRPCAGLMIFNAAQQVWVGQRIPSFGKEAPGGLWQMPQGGIDDGEEARVAALRELREETGIQTATIVAESHDWHTYDLPSHLLGRVWGGRYRGQTQKWFAVRFTGDDSEINISPTDHEPEFGAWRWVAINDLLDLVVPFKRRVYEMVIAEFRPILTASHRN
jgi:putative (di)nucleoside polyphosphate hydrolase